jgi:hypothetical protein
MARKTKPAPVRNEALYRAMVGIRQSSAASPHKDSRTQRARTRSASKARAIREFA